MKKNYMLKFVMVLLWTGFILPQSLLAQPEQAQTAVGACVGYQSDRCECPQGEKSPSCKCDPCTGDEKCVCITAVRAKSGTITGTISLYRTKAKTKGPKSYKDVVVYLEKVGNNDFPVSIKEVRMDQKRLIFIPHVIAIQKGTNVEFLNSDNDKHNVYFVNDQSGKTKDLGTWQPGESRDYKFETPHDHDGDHEIVKKAGINGEPDTMIVLCKLHLEMAAYVVILDNPFFTMAVIDGETQKAQYTIKNVPPGKYTLKIWHKKLKLMGLQKEVVVEQGKKATVDLVITKSKYAKKKG